jgi:hypothetical protein
MLCCVVIVVVIVIVAVAVAVDIGYIDQEQECLQLAESA